jgi:small subunit ribosomal protein S1
MENVTDEMAENALSMIENVDPTFANDREAFPEQVKNDYDEIEDQTQDSDSFMELYEESLKSIQEGKVIKGEIVQIDNEFVLVDIGYKSEGQIHINEFMNSDGQLTAQVGQKVDVLLVRKEDKE